MYPRLAPTCEWDTAAAHAIVLEARARLFPRVWRVRVSAQVCKMGGKFAAPWVLNGRNAMQAGRRACHAAAP